MSKSFAKEIKAELEAMRAGKSRIEVCPEKEAHLYRKPRRGSKSAVKAPAGGEKLLSVEVSRSAYAMLIRVARREKIGVSELIERLARERK